MPIGNDVGSSSNSETSKASVVGALGLAVGGVFFPQKDVGPQKNVAESFSSSIPPVVETANDPVNNDGGMQFEKINPDNAVNFSLDGSTKEILEEEGWIIIDGMQPFTIDSFGTNEGSDAYTVREGAILNIGGAKMKVVYSENAFGELSFIKTSPEGKLQAGQIFPYIAFLPDGVEGKQVNITNYVEPLPAGREKDINVNSSHVVIPIITAGTSTSILLPNVEKSEDGKNVVIKENVFNFQIDETPNSKITSGYISFVIGEVVQEGDGSLTLEILGFVTNRGDEKVGIENLPDGIISKCGLDKQS